MSPTSERKRRQSASKQTVDLKRLAVVLCFAFAAEVFRFSGIVHLAGFQNCQLRVSCEEIMHRDIQTGNQRHTQTGRQRTWRLHTARQKMADKMAAPIRNGSGSVAPDIQGALLKCSNIRPSKWSLELNSETFHIIWRENF